MTKQFLTQNEVIAASIALTVLIEDMEQTATDIRLPLTPKARQEVKEIIEAAKSAKQKLDVTSGKEVFIAPYQEGDEKDFLTKES